MNRNARSVLTPMLPGLMIASFLLSWLGPARAAHAQLAQAKTGNQLHRFTTPDIDGSDFASEDLLGRTPPVSGHCTGDPAWQERRIVV